MFSNKPDENLPLSFVEKEISASDLSNSSEINNQVSDFDSILQDENKKSESSLLDNILDGVDVIQVISEVASIFDGF